MGGNLSRYASVSDFHLIAKKVETDDILKNARAAAFTRELHNASCSYFPSNRIKESLHVLRVYNDGIDAVAHVTRQAYKNSENYLTTTYINKIKFEIAERLDKLLYNIAMCQNDDLFDDAEDVVNGARERLHNAVFIEPFEVDEPRTKSVVHHCPCSVDKENMITIHRNHAECAIFIVIIFGGFFLSLFLI